MTADDSGDVDKYTELLLKAAECLLSLLGYNVKRLAKLTQPVRKGWTSSESYQT